MTCLYVPNLLRSFSAFFIETVFTNKIIDNFLVYDKEGKNK